MIGHLKHDHRMHRCYLKGRQGDAFNAVLTAVGYEFSLLLAWLGVFGAWIRGGLIRHFGAFMLKLFELNGVI